MKLGVKNFGFCIKLLITWFVCASNFQRQCWLYAGLYSLFVYTKSLYTQLTTLLYIKFYLGMDNSSDTALTIKSCSSQIHSLFLSGSHLFYCVIKTTPSDAESREEQDGSKQKFVGRTMAKLWPNLCQFICSKKAKVRQY